MKNLMSMAVLICLGWSLAAQTNFIIEDRISSGPYIDLQDGAITIYAWVQKEGVLAKKIGRSYNGKTPVVVDVLLIKKFNQQGKLIEEQMLPTEVDADRISGLGSYVVCADGGKLSICTEKNAFAKKGDPQKDELLKQYPLSAGKKDIEMREEYQVSFIGAGLLGNKEPYTVTVKKRAQYGDIVKTLEKSENEVQSFETNDDNSAWKPEGTFNKEKLFNPYNGHSITVYAKSVKKDKTKKFNYLQERKVLSFDEKGNQISEKDITFDNLKFSHQNRLIYDKNGRVAGFALVFIDAWGMGYKKSNPTLVRENAKVLLFDEKGNFITEVDIVYPVEMGLLDVIYVPLVMKTDAGHTIFLNVAGKKKADQEAAIISFLVKDGQVSSGPSKSIKELRNHADGKSGVINLSSGRDIEEITPLSNGAVLMTKTEENVSADKIVTYPCDSYVILDENQNMKHVGNIPRDAEDVGEMPITIITPVSDNQTIYAMQGKSKSTIYILNTNDYSWEKVEAPAKLHNIFSAQVEGSDLYLFSTAVGNPTEYRIDKRSF